jgi:hypothetical protein
MKRHLLAMSFCGTLGACASIYPAPPPPPPFEPPPPPVASAPFAARDFAWSAQHGSAGIRAQVAFTQDGRRYSCVGQPVVLTPDAPFSRSRMIALYGSDDRAALPVTEVRSRQANRPSGDYSAFVRKSVCDAQNRFVFQGLPAGDWYAIVVAQPLGGGEQIALMRRIRTRSGAVRTVTID